LFEFIEDAVEVVEEESLNLFERVVDHPDVVDDRNGVTVLAQHSSVHLLCLLVQCLSVPMLRMH
jgi:Mg/Co/Ni transporter MgtE